MEKLSDRRHATLGSEEEKLVEYNAKLEKL